MVPAGGRAEVQLDAAHFLRIGGDTEVRLADIENGHYQIQVAHGLVTWRILSDSQSQAEIDTPLVGVHPGRQSVVRVEVNPDGTSHITVRKGEAEVSTQKGSEKVAENNTMDVRGAATDPEFQVVAAAARDEWDGWNDQRDSYLQHSQSRRYVTQDVHGVEDLDQYGHWVYDQAYGWVWAPTVAANWAPYQNGQWVWEDYYGWTWVDYAPWGWAPFHYGYWYNRVGLGWAWYPGPRIGHVWYRPAMVGFFGWGGGVGVGVGFGFGNIGWVALAPYEVFRPWYGPGFGGGVFVGAGLRGGGVIGAYRNASVLHGVNAVTAADFQRGNFRNTVAVDRATLSQASMVRGGVPVTPTSQNLRFSNRAVTSVPSASAGSSNQRFFGSRASASAARTPFTQQQATVRAAVSGGGAATVQNRMQSQPAAAMQNRAAGQTSAAQNSANWSRFQGTPANANGAGSSAAGPRQVQVSPSIIRERPEATQQQQARPQSQPANGYGQQARPQQAPAQSAPRSAPAGGNRSAGSRGGRR